MDLEEQRNKFLERQQQMQDMSLYQRDQTLNIGANVRAAERMANMEQLKHLIAKGFNYKDVLPKRIINPRTVIAKR